MAEQNRHLWGEKPYHSLDYELKKQYGEKIYKLTLSSGLNCPNRDGKLGYGGCIFCSEGGSGEFAASAALPVSQQIEQAKALLSSKRPVSKYIAYFQSFSNTYGPADYLEKIFTEAILCPEVVILSIATRPDCFSDEIYDLLARLARVKPVWVELGLQTIHENTAAFIRRGYELSCYEEAVRRLTAIGVTVITHTIFGLPGESTADMLESVRYVNTLPVSGIKLQLLHVLKGTDLATLYEAAPFHVFSMEEYIDLVIDALQICRPDMVIHRLTGDGPKDLLIAPMWSTAKRTVLNNIHHRMKERDAWQGKEYHV